MNADHVSQTGAGAERLGTWISTASDMTQTSRDVMTFVGCLALGTSIGAFCLNMSAKPEPWLDPPQMLIICFATGILIAAVGWYFWGAHQELRHYENGVERTIGDRVTAITWDELDSVQSEWVHHYNTGIYVCTHITLSFQSEDGRKIKHKSGVGSSERKYKSLEALQLSANEVVAERMLNKLAVRGRTRWTEDTDITNSGIEFRGIDARFDRISRFKVEEGTLKIWTDGSWVSSFKMEVTETNFQPGLMVFEQMMHKYAREPAIGLF